MAQGRIKCAHCTFSLLPHKKLPDGRNRNWFPVMQRHLENYHPVEFQKIQDQLGFDEDDLYLNDY